MEWLSFPPPGDLPDPEKESASWAAPALAGEFFTTRPPGKPTMKTEDLKTQNVNTMQKMINYYSFICCQLPN